MSHTKGRLSRTDGYLRNADGQAVAVLGIYGNNFDFQRIVALWNAAEELGLTTEDIEAGAIQAVFREPLVILQDGPTRAAAVQRAADSRRELNTVNECHQRCMHCGVYQDECMCDGGRS